MPRSEDFSICWNGRINHELVKNLVKVMGHEMLCLRRFNEKKIKKRRSALKSKEIEGENSIQEANALRR